jgi:hypothetical protein
MHQIFSMWYWKHEEMKVMDEYLWVIMQVAGWSYCGRSISRVMEFWFKVHPLVYMCIVDHMYSQLWLAQILTCAGPSGAYLFCMSESVCMIAWILLLVLTNCNYSRPLINVVVKFSLVFKEVWYHIWKVSLNFIASVPFFFRLVSVKCIHNFWCVDDISSSYHELYAIEFGCLIFVDGQLTYLLTYLLTYSMEQGPSWEAS